MATKTKTPSLAQRAKTDVKLRERMLANPGLRSQLADHYLSPEQLASRLRQRYVADIGDITTPMTGDSLVNAAKQLVDNETAPQLAELDRAAKQTAAQRDQQQQWAKTYADNLSGLFGSQTAAQSAASAKAVADAQARQAATARAIQVAASEAAGRGEIDAAVRGQGLDGGAAHTIAGQGATDAARAQLQGAAAVDQAAAAGNTDAALLRGIVAAAAQRGSEQQGAIGARAGADLGDLAAKRKSIIAGTKGDLTDTLLKLRGSEADRLLTQRGLATDAEKAQLDAQTDALKIKTQADLDRAKLRQEARLAALGISADQAKQQADQDFQAAQKALDRANAVDVAKTNHAKDGKAGGFTHAERVKAAKFRDDAIGFAQLNAATTDRHTMLSALTSKYGSIYAKIAVNLAYDHGRGQKHLLDELRKSAGVTLPKNLVTGR